MSNRTWGTAALIPAVLMGYACRGHSSESGASTGATESGPPSQAPAATVQPSALDLTLVPPDSTATRQLVSIEALLARADSGIFMPLRFGEEQVDLPLSSTPGQQLVIRVRVGEPPKGRTAAWSVRAHLVESGTGGAEQVAPVPIGGPYVVFLFAISGCTTIELTIDLMDPDHAVAQSVSRRLPFVCGE